MASGLTNACTAPDAANPRMSGQSVSQNMKKPSRRLLPIGSSQPAPATSTATVPAAIDPTHADTPPFVASRTDQTGDRLGRLVELRLCLVTAGLHGIGDTVRHMVAEQLQRHRLEGPGGGRDLLDYIDAIAVLVHHALQPPHLPFDATQPLLDRFLLVDVTGMRH